MSALETPDRPAPEDVIDEHRELFERLAGANLPVSDRLRAALKQADGGDPDA